MTTQDVQEIQTGYIEWQESQRITLNSKDLKDIKLSR
jgi:hypothetical protein